MQTIKILHPVPDVNYLFLELLIINTPSSTCSTMDGSQIKSHQITLYYLKLRNYRHGKTWRYKNEINKFRTHPLIQHKHKYLQYIHASGEQTCTAGVDYISLIN
jgi:hypothetical protein